MGLHACRVDVLQRAHFMRNPKNNYSVEVHVYFHSPFVSLSLSPLLHIPSLPPLSCGPLALIAGGSPQVFTVGARGGGGGYIRKGTHTNTRQSPYGFGQQSGLHEGLWPKLAYLCVWDCVPRLFGVFPKYA